MGLLQGEVNHKRGTLALHRVARDGSLEGINNFLAKREAYTDSILVDAPLQLDVSEQLEQPCQSPLTNATPSVFHCQLKIPVVV